MGLLLRIWGIVVVVSFGATIWKFDEFCSTPRDIQDVVGVNLPTAVVIWMVMFLLNPLLFVVKFVNWLIHVGM